MNEHVMQLMLSSIADINGPEKSWTVECDFEAELLGSVTGDEILAFGRDLALRIVMDKVVDVRTSDITQDMTGYPPRTTITVRGHEMKEGAFSVLGHVQQVFR